MKTLATLFTTAAIAALSMEAHAATQTSPQPAEEATTSIQPLPGARTNIALRPVDTSGVSVRPLPGNKSQARPRVVGLETNCHVDVTTTEQKDALLTVHVAFKTPDMPSFHQGGTYADIEGDAVNEWTQRVAKRICYNASHNFNDPCSQTNYKIHGIMENSGVYDCSGISTSTLPQK